MNTYKSGGDINEQNKEMLMSQAIEFKHHAEELMNALKKVDDIDSWVIAKAERATTDLSDITHYLEGRSQKMAAGGIVNLPEKIMQEVQESLSSGYTIIQEGLVGKNRRGVVLVDENYKVRGVYPLKYKEAIENLKKSMGYSRGGYMEEGGETEEGEDLLEDIENLPEEVQEILSNYEDEIEDGDYKAIEQALKELEEIGYTFDYGLDGIIYNLRKIGQKGKHEADMEHGGYMAKGGGVGAKEYKLVPMIPYGVKGYLEPDYKNTIRFKGTEDEATSKAKELAASNPNFVRVEIKREMKTKVVTVGIVDGGMMASGGEVKFEDKVASIKRKLLERKSVSPSVQKDYGMTYSEEEAEESARRIAGAMRKKGY